MATYKVTKCKDKANHDKRMCFYWHTKGDRRRNPFDVLYTCTECPNSSETVNCESGDACLKAHNMLERMFHPDLFKISMCQRGPNGSHCERGNLCAFAHSEEDHRVPTAHVPAKPTLASHLPAPPAVLSPAAAAAALGNAALLAGDTISAGKSMSDSRMLDLIQDKLVKLIKNQGTEGIISSELPKRYYDAYSERLELADEAGEKFRIKDLLLSHTNISVTMHKGVQPKYVYEEIEPPAPAPVPAKTNGSAGVAVPKPSNPTTTGFSYSAIATKNAPKSAAPLNYAAAAAPVAPVSTTDLESAPVSALANVPVAETNGRKRGPAPVEVVEIADVQVTSDVHAAKAPPSLATKISDLSARPTNGEVVYNQWANSSASLFDTSAPLAGNGTVGSALPGSPFQPLGGRRRGPESGADRLDTVTPPLSHSSSFSNVAFAHLSPGNAPMAHSAGGSTGTSPVPSLASVPPGIPSNGSSAAASPGKQAPTSAAEYHERLVQANNTCEALVQQVQALQGELSKRSVEADRQTQQLKGMISQLSESADIQNKTNSAKDAAVSEMNRVRHELQEMKSQGGDLGQKNRELLSRDTVITQLKQERTADLNQFCVNLTQIESALVDMQRKEAMYINEIPLHDTINESSRARDELTKFVSVLKMQLNTKIAADAPASNGFLKPVSSNSNLNGIGNLSNLLGISAKPETDVFGSPMRSAFSAQSAPYMPNGFLGANQGSALLHDDFSLDFSGGDSLLFPGGAAGNNTGGSKILGSSSLLGSSLLSGNVGGSVSAPASGNAMVCALPGCHAEGTFICSACNRSGYCGAQHQR